MAAGDIRYVRAPWGPGQLIQYVDTGAVYNEAPIYQVVVSTDNVASAGLASVYNSLGYRIAEIERHLHSFERWFGSDGATGGSLNSLTPFVLDSANNNWGAWVPVLDANDTPVLAGSIYFDPHRIMVSATERTTPYRVQFAFGANAAAALAAGTYTSFMYVSGSNLVDSGPMDVHSRRLAVGTPIWARCWTTTDTGTFDFFLGIHEYEG